ncbi:hypothetical protein L2088_16330 [Pseudomonas protegens]|uniref:hypothetical protein n=1 Tax=Pseudomonas protegens TaxID=380021 RepID=UPI00202475C2|nr:hypothetical protein [Pseudomonas protegens]MCL9656273.1 hypothetical protein [Pseudomonas protegens]
MDRYQALKSNLIDKPVLFIDRAANPIDLYTSAQQRIKAAANLLETLTCLSFRHADTVDTEHIIQVLYLLVQDGNDLLESAHTH